MKASKSCDKMEQGLALLTSKGTSQGEAKSESNNKLDKCLKRAYSKVDDQVHGRALSFRS